MHAIDGMACAKRGCDNRGKLGLNVEHHRGELFPRVGFIVTNMTLPSRSVVRFYNKRGTAEQWIKEGKQATHWTRLSCHRSSAKAVLEEDPTRIFRDEHLDGRRQQSCPNE